MRLPTTALQPADAPDAPAEERRVAFRFAANAEASCQPLAARRQESWPARVRDVSATGIGLLVRRRFEAGTVLALELQDAPTEFGVSLVARVVHVTALDDGVWLVGCALTSELDDDELRLFHAERSRPEDGSDCRAWVRNPCDITTTCHSVPPAPPARWTAVICDVSPGGLGLLVPAPIESGVLLSVELPGDMQKPPRRVLVRVARPSALAAGDWLLGCEFARRIAEDELQLLRGPG